MNKIVELQQMDLAVKYWDLRQEHVKTRYLTSVFLGHTNASALVILVAIYCENFSRF